MTTQDSPIHATLDPQLQQQLQQEKVGALVMTARRALRQGNKKEARQELKKALQLDVNDCGALELLGEYFMAEGEQEKALEVLERGHKLHPSHASFEKNIALCILDIEEMKRSKEQHMTLGEDDPDQWMDRKPFIAACLSVLPGAGQYYNGDEVTAGVLFGGWLLTLIGWFLPLMTALKNLPRDAEHTFSLAVAQMSGAGRVWFWLMFAIWVGFYVYALVDALVGAARANARRRFEREAF